MLNFSKRFKFWFVLSRNYKQFCLQRKPEEETHQGDNEAKKSKPEPAVNGGGGNPVPSGNEVVEKMEEEVGSWARSLGCTFYFISPPLCSGMVLCLVDVLVLLPAVLHKVFQIRWIFLVGRCMLCCGADPVWAGQIQLWNLVTCGVGQRQVLGVFFCWAQLQHKGLPPIFNVPGFYFLPLGCTCYCQCFRVMLGSGDLQSSHS